MGMTIDKTIEFFNGLECHTPQAKDAIDVAIDTMQKYQKIQEIIKDWEDGRFSDAVGCLRVKVVVEDGND